MYKEEDEEYTFRDIAYLLVYISQTVVALLVPLLIRRLSKLLLLSAGVVLSGAWFLGLASHVPPALHIVFGLCLGTGYALTFTCLLHIIADRSSTRFISSNFSLFSSCIGFSYSVMGAEHFIYSLTSSSNVTDVTEASHANSTRVLHANVRFLMYLVGSCLLISYVFSKKLEQFAETDNLIPKDQPREMGRKAKVSLLVMVIYYGFVSSILFQLFSACSLSINYQAQSITCYGAAFAVVSIYVQLVGKTEPTNSAILATLMVFGFIISGLLFPRRCIAGEEHLGTSSDTVLVPIAGLFLGGGSGFLTCEILSLVSTVWSCEYKYCILVAVQGLCSAACTLLPDMAHPRNFIVVSSLFTVLYYFLAVYVHAVLQSRALRAVNAKRYSIQPTELPVTYHQSVISRYY